MKMKRSKSRRGRSARRKVKAARKSPLVVNGTPPANVTPGVGDWPEAPVEARDGVCGIPEDPARHKNGVNGGRRPDGSGPDEPVRL